MSAIIVVEPFFGLPPMYDNEWAHCNFTVLILGLFSQLHVRGISGNSQRQEGESKGKPGWAVSIVWGAHNDPGCDPEVKIGSGTDDR